MKNRAGQSTLGTFAGARLSFMRRLAIALHIGLASGFVLNSSVLLSAQKHPVPAVQNTETQAQRDARMKWWRAARFGMFIHWGIYAVPAGTWDGKPVPGGGEWIMHNAKITVADYARLAPQFDPENFNAHTWVSLAKAAGMKYIVITAKHHDGFAMFDSKANSFNIANATPFKRDPLLELADECRKQGIMLGFYYSQNQDWTAPGGVAYGGHWDKAQDGDYATYLHTKAIPQLKELLTNYQPYPSIVWFDTPSKDMTPQLAGEIVSLLNKYPNLIWNNRLGGGYGGDTETPEQKIPPQGYPGKDWESCMTINGTWGYKSDDTNFKSTRALLYNLIDIASKGGNYLLNVGPDAHGAIPAAEADRLREIGKWLDVNGEAIYSTGSTVFGDEAGVYSTTAKDKDGKPLWVAKWDWRSTTRPGRIYIHIFNWPGENFHLEKVPGKITRAYLLADPQHRPLDFVQNGSAMDVHLPKAPLDPLVTVLVLEKATK
jgi:alpha-L-fucosidase